MSTIAYYDNSKVTIFTNTLTNGSILVCAKFADGEIYCVKKIITNKGWVLQPVSKLCYDVLAQGQ